jgi:class 3 adenylate cyclase/tetratricopeptide (TPR) repeat protein
MKCPSCHHANPAGTKFCDQCARSLMIDCPRCGKINPPESKFCNECAFRLESSLEPVLKELTFDEKIAKIQQYLPNGIVDKVLAQRNRIEGERKIVTVMFCDMESYYQIAELIGPEEAFKLMNEVYDILIHKVHDFEGTVNELTGDGIMALYGAPIALEDAPQRAIHSAFAIHRELVKFNEKTRQKSFEVAPIKMRIGIHTGPVVVGSLGKGIRVEFKAVGDTVNLASRMEELAQAGTTLVSEDTFRMTEGFFRFESLGERQVKGKDKPVNTYRVIAPKSRKTRFDVHAERGLTPIIGRERELELLLEGFEQTETGHGRVYSIIANAGLGKSRLLYEFRKLLSNENATFLEGRCFSYSRNTAYHCFADILRSNFNIHEQDGDIEIRHKVSTVLEKMNIDESSIKPYLLELLSVKDSGIDDILLSREAKKNRIFEAIKRLVLRGSQIRPLVMAFEDLHWIDNSSEEILRYIVNDISNERVMLIFTVRPQYSDNWYTKFQHHRQLTLSRLSNRECRQIICHVIKSDRPDPLAERFVLDKAEGIPLFIEEFVRALQELKLFDKQKSSLELEKEVQGLQVPATIQEVIMARVDSLPEAAKDLVQLCAVIARRFSGEILAKLTGYSKDQLLPLLEVLEDAELVYDHGRFSQPDYIFKHSLIREVVYESLLNFRKRQLHQAIADNMVELYQDRLEEYYGILAEHYRRCECYEKAADYFELAGQRAGRAAAIGDAIHLAAQRIEILERLPRTPDIEEKILSARTDKARFLFWLNYMTAAKKAVDPIIELALARGDKSQLCQIFAITGTYYFMVEENFTKGYKHLEEAVRISEETDDMVATIMANYLLGLALSWDCEFERSSRYIEKTLEIFVDLNVPWGISVMKSLLSFYAQNRQGLVTQGYHSSLEALQIAEQSDDILSKAMAYTSHGIANFFKGFLKKAEEYLLQGAVFCEQLNLHSYGVVAHHWLGNTYYELSDFSKSAEYFRNAGKLRGRSGLFPSTENVAEINEVRAEVALADKTIDVSRLYRLFHANQLRLYHGGLARSIAEVLLHINGGMTREALNWIDQALRSHNKNHMNWDLGRDNLTYAQIFSQSGDRLNARKHLEQARHIFQDCGSDGWVRIVDPLLDQV